MPEGSCGLPGPDFELAILDPHVGHVRPALEEGEICVRPRVPGVATLGYEGDAQATVDLWRGLWLHTGDLGYLDREGYLFVRGRLKEMIRSGGENICVTELEQIVRTHPVVADCAAVGIPSDNGEQEVKLVVVCNSSALPSVEAMSAFFEASMARFMVPRVVEFRSALPYTLLGKLERDKLVEDSTDVLMRYDLQRRAR
jgi:crotonobetaine/carnitine-CoA ligase